MAVIHVLDTQHLGNTLNGYAVTDTEGRETMPAYMEQNPQSSRRQTSDDKT